MTPPAATINLAAVPGHCSACAHFEAFPDDHEAGECLALPPQVLQDPDTGEPFTAERIVPAGRRACVYFKHAT